MLRINLEWPHARQIPYVVLYLISTDFYLFIFDNGIQTRTPTACKPDTFFPPPNLILLMRSIPCTYLNKEVNLFRKWGRNEKVVFGVEVGEGDLRREKSEKRKRNWCWVHMQCQESKSCQLLSRHKCLVLSNSIFKNIFRILT